MSPQDGRLGAVLAASIADFSGDFERLMTSSVVECGAWTQQSQQRRL